MPGDVAVGGDPPLGDVQVAGGLGPEHRVGDVLAVGAGLPPGEELGGVHAGHHEAHGGRLELAGGLVALLEVGAGAGRQVGAAGAVDEEAGADRGKAGLVADDGFEDAIAGCNWGVKWRPRAGVPKPDGLGLGAPPARGLVARGSGDDGVGELGVEKDPRARLDDPPVVNPLEDFRVDADPVQPAGRDVRHLGLHLLDDRQGQPTEDRLLPVGQRGPAGHQGGGGHAAQEAELLDQQRAGPVAGGGDGRGDPGRPAPGHQHVHLRPQVQPPGRIIHGRHDCRSSKRPPPTYTPPVPSAQHPCMP